MIGHVADLYGEAGKHSFDRQLWFHRNTDLIKGVALGLTDGWLNADKPFAFLAACIELKAFAEHGPGFVTHLPVLRSMPHAVASSTSARCCAMRSTRRW